MNRYFFDVVCEGREYIDWKGNHFLDLKAAKDHAAKIARELVQVSSDNVSCSVCIADEHGIAGPRWPSGRPTTVDRQFNHSPSCSIFDPCSANQR